MRFPDFKSHEEAKRFFIEKYGKENFKLDSSESHEVGCCTTTI